MKFPFIILGVTQIKLYKNRQHLSTVFVDKMQVHDKL